MSIIMGRARSFGIRRHLSLEALERRELMAITIFAAGQTNEESMQLLIDGQVVQSWTNIGGNATTGQFIAYEYSPATNVNLDRIRVAFTNDVYAPPLDRNLRVDRIVVDGVTYQTEAASVYSTGTWLPADGIQPGFRQNEFLHANGYFQYAVNTGSIIQIFAGGETGLEAMELQIDGRVAYSWIDVGGDGNSQRYNEFTYRAAGSISPSQVRVAFTNDYDDATVDYNLRIDKIIINGIEYETESPSVLSTGTYVPAQNGIVTGYWQTEWLHSDGYFQYGGNAARPGTLALQTSVIDVREGSASVAINVVRSSGSDGTIGIEYKTGNGTALAGSDYTSVAGTLTFLPGQTVKTINVPILNNTTKESPETFSLVIEKPTGGATLLAPRTATITITDDDLVLPNYTSFPSSTGLKLNGNASIASNALQLTPNVANQRGTAFYNTPIPINLATSFQTQFQLRTNVDTAGGEGFTWMVQNSTAGSSALGTGGSSLAYGGILKSLAIEFDTFRDTGEVSGNHISIWKNGALTNSLSTKNLNIDFNSGSNVNVWIDYNGDSDQLALYVSATSVKPTTPITSTSFDLLAVVGTNAYFGFGAATSNRTNSHLITQWKLNLDRPVTPPPNPNVNLITETVVSSLNEPTAIDFSADGRNMYIAQKDGRIVTVRDGVRQVSPFIDISAQVNNISDRGLLDIAVHPNFASNPYVYLLYTYDPPEVYNNLSHPLAGPDKPGNRAGRLLRVTANAATNFTTSVPGSEVVLLGTNSLWSNFNGFINSTIDIGAIQGGLNPDGSYMRDFIASDSESHTVGSLAFDKNGALLVSIGDGASYNTVDPRATRVQDLDSLSGKILRINPLNGQGYSSNPHATADLNANRSKVYQRGLRNPFRITTNPTNGQVYVGDVGWTQWEEINAGPAGANYGWPYYEGGNGSNLKTNDYQFLQKAIDFYASGQVATPSIYALNHAADGINAIVMGEYYTGTTFPEQYRNNIFFSDLGQGIVRNATLDTNGQVASIDTFATGAAYVVQIVQGKDGNLYFVDLDDGLVGRWRFAPAATSAARLATASPTSARTTLANPTLANPTPASSTPAKSSVNHSATTTVAASLPKSIRPALFRVRAVDLIMADWDPIVRKSLPRGIAK